jgi:hypothetical protein
VPTKLFIGHVTNEFYPTGEKNLSDLFKNQQIIHQKWAGDKIVSIYLQ